VITGRETLAYALQAAGDADAALEVMHKARQVSAGLSAWYEAKTAAAQARLWLILGDVAAAGAGPTTLPCSKPRPPWVSTACLTISPKPGRSSLRTGPTGPLTCWLACRHDRRRRRGRLPDRIPGPADDGLTGAGEFEWTVFPLEHALFLAESEGYVRTFIDHGRLMIEPLTAILAEQQQGRPAAAWRIRPPMSSSS